MNIPPLVLFGATFMVWITAKGELGKYWGFATVAKSKATTAPAGSAGSAYSSTQDANVASGNPLAVDNGASPLLFGISA